MSRAYHVSEGVPGDGRQAVQGLRWLQGGASEQGQLVLFWAGSACRVALGCRPQISSL